MSAFTIAASGVSAEAFGIIEQVFDASREVLALKVDTFTRTRP